MGSAFGAIAVGTRLAVRFQDGLQEALKGSLAHTVTARRKRQEAATCPALLRDRLLP